VTAAGQTGQSGDVGALLAGFAFFAYAFWTYREGGKRSGVYFWAAVIGSAVAGIVCAVVGVAMISGNG
jgi:hypothetical protein